MCNFISALHTCIADFVNILTQAYAPCASLCKQLVSSIGIGDRSTLGSFAPLYVHPINGVIV